MEKPHKVVFIWLGMINPQLLLGAAIAMGFALFFLLRGGVYVRWLKSLPPSMQWAWGAWMDEGTLYTYTLVGSAMFLLFSLSMLGMFIAEQINPQLAR